MKFMGPIEVCECPIVAPTDPPPPPPSPDLYWGLSHSAVVSIVLMEKNSSACIVVFPVKYNRIFHSYAHVNSALDLFLH